MTTADTPTSRERFEVRRPFTPVQWAAVVGSLAILVWSIPGMIVNPDFAIGDSATAELVLGVDMNGWHALSGFLLAMPGLLVASRPHLAALFNLSAAAGLITTGVWALFDTQVAGGLFSLPHTASDALLHFATSAIFLAGAAHYFFTERAR